MFKPVSSMLAEEVRKCASIALIPEIDFYPEIFRIVLEPDNMDEESLFIGRCAIRNKKSSVVYFEHICFDDDVDIDLASRFLLLDMIISKVIRVAKSTDKRNLCVTSNLPMLPEILLDYGFALYSASKVNGDAFLGVKKLKNERRTDYGFNNLTRLKKDQALGSKNQKDPGKNRKVGFVH